MFLLVVIRAIENRQVIKYLAHIYLFIFIHLVRDLVGIRLFSDDSLKIVEMVTEVFQTLEVHLLASVQAASNLRNLIGIDSNDRFHKDKSWPATIWRLLLGLENGVKRMGAVDNTV